MRKNLIFVLVFTLVLTFTIGAGAQDPEEIIDDYTYGGTLTMGATQPPEGMFNPLYAETVYDSDIWTKVFEGLTTYDENFEPVPQLARDWEISDDYLTYTFYLDDRAKFHDGEPVTAEDVKYTFEMFVHPDYTGVRASDFMEVKGAEEFREGEANEVEGITIIDDHTIEIELRSIYAPFLVSTGTYGILPKHILSEYDPSELDQIDFNQEPIGSGPFKLEEYASDEYTHLTAFEDYREGRPYLDNVVWEYVDDQARLMMLENEEFDYAGLASEDFDRAKEWDHITIHKEIDNGFAYIGFNVDKDDSPVSKTAVRQAIAHGVNRTGAHEVLLDGLAVNVNSPISRASWAYTDDLRDYEYDPERAREILRDAGWSLNEDGIFEKDGQTLSFTLNASAGFDFIDDLMALAQDNLNEIGFDVNIERYEFNTLRDMLEAGELETWYMGWNFGADPDPYSVWHSEGDWNRTGFSDPRADELIEKARETLDRTERREYYVEFQQIWNEEMPYLPMFANLNLHAVHDRVRGIDPDPGVLSPFGTGYNRINEVWIPKHYRD